MRTVLLVDEDRDLRLLLGAVLGARGLEVLGAERGSEAEEILGRKQVDLIVAGGDLSDITGMELIERVRARDRGVRIVLISAFLRDLRTFKRLTGELDVSFVLFKPIEPTSFAAKVEELLGTDAGSAGQGGVAAVEDELTKLRREFGEKLPEKLGALDRAIAEARQDPGRMRAAMMLAHRLHGTAGSYGYAAVGELVGVVEDLLQDGLAHGVFRPEFWNNVAEALLDVRRAAARLPDPGRDAANASGRASPEDAPPATSAVLVVDDDPDFLQLVRTMGRRLSVEVVTALSAEEAVQRAGLQRFVAAIFDVHLEGESSFAAVRRIHETEGNGGIPVAFASVDGRLETRVAAVEAGGIRFFEKPISEDGFAELLHQLVTASQQRQPRVLIVDDDVEMAAQYARHLSRAGYAVDYLASADNLVSRLEALRPDVLLLEVSLPRVSGIDICRALRSSDRWAFLPILVVTAQMDPATRVSAYRAGASDVVGKPVLPEELLARVGVQEERMRLLRDRADKDPLSGLMLRRAFVEAMERALATCIRERRPLSLVLFDLDHFKRINDTHGHLAGDRVIAGFGELLRRRFRIEDLRGRWGGEEFVLALPGQEMDVAVQSARRVLRELAEVRFETENRETFGVTVTAGVAAFPDDGSSVWSLVRRADELLYAGKRAGRNMVQGSESSVPGSPRHAEARAPEEPR